MPSHLIPMELKNVTDNFGGNVQNVSFNFLHFAHRG